MANAEQASLQRQREILRFRHEALAAAGSLGETAIKLINDRAFSSLAQVSDEHLRPVLFCPLAADWSVGWLIQHIGCGGARILVWRHGWRIVRVKRSATILTVGKQHLKLFQASAEAQQHAADQIESLLALMESWTAGRRQRDLHTKKGLQKRQHQSKKDRPGKVLERGAGRTNTGRGGKVR